MTSDFKSIKGPLNGALRTRFACYVDNVAALKISSSSKKESLHSPRQSRWLKKLKKMQWVAKGTVYGRTSKSVYKVEKPKGKAYPPRASTYNSKDTPQGKWGQLFSKGSCSRCGKKTTLRKIAYTLMVSPITARRRDICNQFAYPKESRIPESGTQGH